VAFGEIGLASEIRPIQSGPGRLRETVKCRFRQAIVPARGGVSGMEIRAVRRLEEALMGI
jgi:DNA repair protein RadA/Sms